VLTWLAVALGTGAAVVAIGWAVHRTDELGRPRRFPWVTVALLLALGAGAAVPGVLRASQERRLGTAASVLAGARVAVRCQSFGGAFVDAGPELGYVRWRADGSPEPWTLIKDQARPVPPPGRLRALGQAPADAAELAAAYWRNIYPLMPDSYRSAECRPGGAMDERLPDAPWLASTPL
jgi:hypothetical protein